MNMARVRKCYNENCECNIDGAYCDSCEIIISDGGVCESYCPKIEEDNEEDVV
jgi:hypothetical protein